MSYMVAVRAFEVPGRPLPSAPDWHPFKVSAELISGTSRTRFGWSFRCLAGSLAVLTCFFCSPHFFPSPRKNPLGWGSEDKDHRPH